MNFKGTLPALILEALMDQPSHGYRIAQRIKERSQAFWISRKALSTPRFTSWKTKVVVESYEGIEKGRPRRYYRITESWARHVGQGPRGMAGAFASGHVDSGGGISDDCIGDLAEAGNSASIEGFGRSGTERNPGTLRIHPGSRDEQRRNRP